MKTVKTFLPLWLLLMASTAAAVPTSDPRDPPVPQTGLGRLFGDPGQFMLSCAVGSTSATVATVGFSTTYPHRSVSYVSSGGTWSAWSNLAPGTTDYDCTGSCLHSTAEVKIRGCDTAACTGQVQECTAAIGVPVNGPPDLVWSGLESVSAGALGCVQTNATEVAVRMRYAGSHPGSGYPLVGGVAATERAAERATDGAAYVRTYAASPGWSPADVAAGQWSFVVSLDGSGSRDTPARVELKEHCLGAPQASVVGTGGTLAPISSGNAFVGGSELELATGNPTAIFALTSQQLTYNGAPGSFGRLTPTFGATDTAHTWTETATGRDGLTYTSPDLDLTAQATACVSDGTHLIWLDPGGDGSYLAQQHGLDDRADDAHGRLSGGRNARELRKKFSKQFGNAGGGGIRGDRLAD